MDEQYDLLTAALIGVAVGVGATMLMRRGPRGHRPISPMLRAAGRGAKWAGTGSLAGARWAGGRGAEGARWVGGRGAEGARWVGEQAEDLWDRVPVDEARDRVGDMLSAAKETIEDAVESELKDLRKSIRRQRRRLGI